MPSSDLRQLYRRWMLELWNGDLAVAEQIVTGDFVVHQARVDDASSEDLRGPEAVIQMVREGHAFDGLTFEIEVGSVVEGDLVGARWAGKGATRAACPGPPRPPAPRSPSAASTCSGPGTAASPSTGSAPTGRSSWLSSGPWGLRVSGGPDGAGPKLDVAGDFGGFEGRAAELRLPGAAAAGRGGGGRARPGRRRRRTGSATRRPRREVPRRLKDALGRLVGVPADQVILGNSTSYGLHLLVQGVPWREGDEVLLVDGDFPATIVPWLPLAERGVRVRLLQPEGGMLDAGQLEAELTPATQLFCCSWVFSFTGQTVDLAALGEVCRRAGVTFVVNGSQGVGAIPLELAGLPVDALVSCGSGGSAAPMGPASAGCTPTCGLAHLPAGLLAGPPGPGRPRPGHRLPAPRRGRAAAWDVFGTANFLTFEPWTASVEYLLALGVERVAAWDQHLVERFLGGLDPGRYGLVSPRRGWAARPWSSSATTSPSATGCCSSGWPRPGWTWPSGGGGCGSRRTSTTPRPTSTGPSRSSTAPWGRPPGRPPMTVALAREVAARIGPWTGPAGWHGAAVGPALSAGRGRWCRADADVVDEHRRRERRRVVGAL